MAVRVGNAELPVVPVLVKNFSRDLVQQMAGPAQRAATRTGRDAGRQFGRQFERAGDTSGRQFGVRFNKRLGGGFSASTKLATVAAGAIGGAFAAVQIGGFLKGAIDEAREAAKVGKQTAAVIKSTGGVAKITAGQVADLAESISNTVGVDDELIQSGENWLLTFKKVRNEAGQGNDVFNRASIAAVDLAASMHQGEVSATGLHSANTMLGKALNDPIKGMTALAKAGVTFDAQQQKQIKTLVKSGDVLGAQKIILAEVESQVKGFAKASADPWQRMGVAIANVKEDIGKLLLPAISAAADFLTTKLIPAVKSFVDKHGASFGRVFDNVRDAIGGMITKARAWWETHGPAVIQAFHDAKVAVFGVRGELDKTKRAFDDNAAAIQGLFVSVGDLTGSSGLPRLETIMKRIGEEVRAVIKLAGLFSRAWLIASALVNDAVNFVVVTFLEGWRTIVRAVATTAEKLHLPFAKALRKNEQDVGRMAETFRSKLGATQRAINKLHGKDVKVTAKGVWDPPKGFSAKTLIQMSTPGGRGGFAAGGRITQGTGPTADDVLIRASKGEAIVPARSAAKPAFKAWAAEEGIPGYATGGVIAGGVRQMNAITDRVAGGMGTVIARALKRALESGGGGSPAIKAFIRSVDPLPYVWGAAGPGAYDCSGLVSAVYGKHTGKGGGHGQRYFTTSSISASGGLKPGLGGVLDIGVTAGTGHMAGRYGGRNGLGFEAESSRTGIKIGGAASTPESFARHFHMARGGRIDPALVALAARGGADVVGDPGNLRINGQSFDRGGTLAPGLNLVSNRTGRPEPLVPGGGIDYDRLAKAVARALRDAPPVVRVDDVHTGLKAKKRGNGYQKLGLD